jgi:NAD(P)-dependent dehydrogenase (short-subunit alcohol dehydrogenase family)
MIQEQLKTQTQSEEIGGKRVLLSGGTKGIGRATAEALVAEGAKVLVFARHREDLDETLRELQDGPGEIFGVTADQAQPEDVRRVFQAVDEQLGGLDILINNAAVSGDSVTQEGYQDWLYTLHANLAGYMQCVSEAAPRMKQAGGGRIVNVGSLSAKLREEGSDVYVATKAAIRGFTESVSKTLADDGIYVSLVEPGLVATPLTELSEEEQSEKRQKREIIEPEAVAQAILFCLKQPPGCLIAQLHIRPVMQKI